MSFGGWQPFEPHKNRSKPLDLLEHTRFQTHPPRSAICMLRQQIQQCRFEAIGCTALCRRALIVIACNAGGALTLSLCRLARGRIASMKKPTDTLVKSPRS